MFGYRGHKKVVWCLALYKQRLYSSGADNLIKVWDLDVLTNGCIKTMEGHTGVVSGRWRGTLEGEGTEIVSGQHTEMMSGGWMVSGR